MVKRTYINWRCIITRINCIKPSLLLDQHLSASVREGLRPVNDRLAGKPYANAPDNYTLGKGHVIWHRKYVHHTLSQWLQAKEEYIRRGYTGFDWNPPVEAVRALQDTHFYAPTIVDKRHNLARLIVRWRKNPHLYSYCKRPVHTRKEMREWVKMVKVREELK